MAPTQIALSIGLSPSETNAAIRRLEKSGLFSSMTGKPVRSAMEEFLIHGVKYCFPATLGTIDRGIPTSHSALPLSNQLIGGDDQIYVWPYADGNVKGVSIDPLYKSVPKAALQDQNLYECLALIDALRIGKAREKNLATDLLIERIKSK